MKIDMSHQAVSTRLRRVAQLRELCLALAGPRLRRPWGVPSPREIAPVAKENRAAYGGSRDLPGKTTESALPSQSQASAAQGGRGPSQDENC